MKKFIIIVISLLVISLCLVSCNSEDVNIPDDETTETTTEGPIIDGVHYLVFKSTNGVTIAKLAVLPTDTYESLKPFFPTIPEGEGTHWPVIEKVFLNDKLEIVITAED